LHATMASEALRRGLPLFLEKPLAINREQLRELASVYREHPGYLQVGFNRRFAPVMRRLKEFFAFRSTPLLIQYRINAGTVPAGHWTQDPAVGGGRIIGEVCHRVVCAQYLTGEEPRRVFAAAVSASAGLPQCRDNVSIALEMSDGSLVNLFYTSSGDPGVPKERIEVFGEGATAIVDGFARWEFRRGSRREHGSGKVQQRHKEEIAFFVEAVRDCKEPEPSFASVMATTLTTFAIEDSLGRGLPVIIDPSVLGEAGNVAAECAAAVVNRKT